LKNKSYNIIFCLSILIIIGATFLSLYLLRQAQQYKFWANRKQQIEIHLNSILQNLFEIEASRYGYEISNNKKVLEANTTPSENLKKELSSITSFSKGIPERDIHTDSLKKLINKYLITIDLKNTNLRDKNSIEIGENLIGAIRDQVAMIISAEQKIMNGRTKNLATYDYRSLISVAIAGLLTLIVISLGFVKLKREIYYKELALLERLEAVEVLEESELRYRNLNESSNDAIIIADDSGNIISWNPSAANVFGYGEMEVIGSPLNIIMPQKYKEAHNKGLQQLKYSGSGSKMIGQRLELSGRNKSGKEFPIEITLGHWHINNKHFFSGVIRDISERKKSEKKHARLVENLKRSNQDLEQFAYVASHDLQEPLRKIQSFGERVINKHSSEISAQGQEYISRMMEAANRMHVLIEDLLSFSVVSRNAESKENIQLQTVLDRVKDDLQVKITETKTIINSAPLPELKKASFIQLTQLFSNIINNAIKFQKAGNNPVINIEVKNVQGKDVKSKETSVSSGKTYLEIKVNDNGIGFDNKYTDKIFTIFQRLHGRSEYAGTGIGLAVCKKICENHDGFITANGRPNEGSTFIIYLPQ